jgi:site-specific recombinase XerD
MATLELVPRPQGQALEALVDMALATVNSEHTRRIYRSKLVRFLGTGLRLTREDVGFHLRQLREEGCSASVTLSTLAAIKKLAYEAQAQGCIDFNQYLAIKDLKGGKHYRTRMGMWLTVSQVQTLLGLPDDDWWGIRDRALLALLVGCGLRRAELAELPWSVYQPREGRMCLVDLVGKGNKKRTVPVPTWAEPHITQWRETSQEQPPEPTGMRKVWAAKRNPDNPLLVARGTSEDAIEYLVTKYGERMQVRIRPHDLRRTLAQMMRRAGAPLEQIQAQLGHESVQTTQIYLGLGIELEAGKAGVDLIPMPVPRKRSHSVVIPPCPMPPLPGKIGKREEQDRLRIQKRQEQEQAQEQAQEGLGIERVQGEEGEGKPGGELCR